MPGWVLAIFAAIAAIIPAGVFFTAYFLNFTYSGYGTGSALDAAPAPLLGAGIVPALFALSALYGFARRSRRRPPGE